MYFPSLTSRFLHHRRVQISVFVVIFMCFGLMVSINPVSAADPTATTTTETVEKPAFRKDPIFDLRPINLNISKESDGQFEVVIGNPTLNDHALAGEVEFRVPPGVTIFSSLAGGSGGTGLVLAPFDRDPVRPGSTHVKTWFVKSQILGPVQVLTKVTFWPVGNRDGDKEVNLSYDANVVTMSGASLLAPAIVAPVVATVVSPPVVPTADPSARSSGGCSIGGSPEAGLATMFLIIPALSYAKRRNKGK